MWSLSGIPCSHAIGAIYFMRDNPVKYVINDYSVEKFAAAYSFFLEPINGEKLWKKTNTPPLLPPKQRRMPGRPKKLRRKEMHEKQKNNYRVSKVGTKIKCGNCGVIGHNIRGCKAPKRVPQPSKKGKRPQSDKSSRQPSKKSKKDP